MGFIYKVSCSKCDYNFEIVSGNKQFQFKDETIKLKDVGSEFRSLWCHSCQKVQTVFMGKVGKNREIYFCEDKIEVVTAKLKKLGIFSFIKIIDLKSKLRSLRSELENIRLKTNYYELCIFWESLKVHPRCMECGSKNIELKEIIFPKEYSKPISLEIQHSCGGELIIEKYAHVTWSEYTKIFYNSKGEVVEKQILNKRDNLNKY